MQAASATGLHTTADALHTAACCPTSTPLQSSHYRSPSIEVPTQSITPTGATAKMSANAKGGPYERFVLAVCPKPASGAPNWDKCPSTTCLLAQAAACPIGNLSPGRKYTVSAVAYTADDTASGRSAAVDFTTQPWP